MHAGPIGFVTVPLNQTCGLGENTTFSCQPEAQNGVNITVTWTVNDKSLGKSSELSYLQREVGGEYMLKVIGCRSDWDGYRIKCVLIVTDEDSEIFSSTAFLNVKSEAQIFFKNNTDTIVSHSKQLIYG